jgi:hypothetical protein
MLPGIVQAEARSPVVNDEGDVLELERLDEPLDVAVVIGEYVIDVRLIGLAETDVVRRDDPALIFDVGHDVAPQIGRCRLAVQEENGIAFTLVDVVHSRTVNLDVSRLVGKLGRDLHWRHLLTEGGGCKEQGG